jgi:hypothetical protein
MDELVERLRYGICDVETGESLDEGAFAHVTVDDICAVIAALAPVEAVPVACSDEAHDHPGHEWRVACIKCGVFRGSDLLAHPPAQAGAVTEELEAYYARQIEWSRATFGPALRTKGVIDHIRKELEEIAADPHDLSEWIDVIILAMDGFWRHGGTASDLMPRLLAKQHKNMARTWPDWRTMSEDSAIEHDRSTESPDAALGAQTPPEGAAVAQGWRLAPVEPTETMVEDGVHAYQCTGISAELVKDWTAEDHVKFIYSAMLAAAPTPPVNQSEGADRG